MLLRIHEIMAVTLIFIAFAAILVLLLAVRLFKSRGQSSNINVGKIPNVLPTIGFSVAKRMLLFQMERARVGIEILQASAGVDNLYRKIGILSFNWGNRIYHIFHHTTVEPILSSNIYINKGWIYRIMNPWLGTGLLTSSDNKWRKMRKLLTPAFHFHILEDFIAIFNEQSKILVKKMESYCNREWIDISPPLSLCTLDIIGESAMGISLDAQKETYSEYVDSIKRISNIILQRFMKPWFWNSIIFYLSSEGRELMRCLKIVHGYDRMIIRKRKQKLMEQMEESEELDDFESANSQMGIKKRRTFLDLLLYHHLTYRNISEEEIADEVNTFMFEGHDTTACAASLTLYLLGCHPDIQDKVYEEQYGVFGDDKEREITTEDLKRMKYLECVIKESLRLYPPVPHIVRKHVEDVHVGNYKIKASSELAIKIYSLHRDPEVFPNPEMFDPDRFLPENSVGRHPFAYIPFSAGPRNCIGQRFAMMEEKTILSHIIRNFTLRSLDHRDKLLLSCSLILRAENGLRVEIRKRVEKT